MIADSLGGLDARHLVGHLGAAIVKSKALLLRQIEDAAARAKSAILRARFGFDEGLNIVRGAIRTGDISGLADYLKSLFHPDLALKDLTTERCAAMFPSDLSDMQGVPVFSCAGLLAPERVSPPLMLPAMVLSLAGTESDALVPLQSATLPRHLGTIATDHFGLVGWSPEDTSSMWARIVEQLKKTELNNQ